MLFGEYMCVIFSVYCQYYCSEIDFMRFLLFYFGFIEWVIKLVDLWILDGDVLQFVKYYGIYFFLDVIFGVKFI